MPKMIKPLPQTTMLKMVVPDEEVLLNEHQTRHEDDDDDHSSQYTEVSYYVSEPGALAEPIHRVGKGWIGLPGHAVDQAMKHMLAHDNVPSQVFELTSFLDRRHQRTFQYAGHVFLSADTAAAFVRAQLDLADDEAQFAVRPMNCNGNERAASVPQPACKPTFAPGILDFFGSAGKAADYVMKRAAAAIEIDCSAPEQLETAQNMVLDRHCDAVIGGRIEADANGLPWVSVDLGVNMYAFIDHVALRHGLDDHEDCLASGRIMISRDGDDWTPLLQLDKARCWFDTPYGVRIWEAEHHFGPRQPCRYVRIELIDRTVTGTYTLCLGGIELYGKLLHVTPAETVFLDLASLPDCWDVTMMPPTIFPGGLTLLPAVTVRPVDEGDVVFDGVHGIFQMLGTRNWTQPWINPQSEGSVVVTHSDGEKLVEGDILWITDPSWDNHSDLGKRNVITSNKKNSWIQFDFGDTRRVVVKSYCIRHGYALTAMQLRYWQLLGSNDGISWTSLRDHVGDKTLAKPNAVAEWSIQTRQRAYRFIRILQCGLNSSGSHRLACAGLELFGTVVTIGAPPLARPTWQEDQFVVRPVAQVHRTPPSVKRPTKPMKRITKPSPTASKDKDLDISLQSASTTGATGATNALHKGRLRAFMAKTNLMKLEVASPNAKPPTDVGDGGIVVEKRDESQKERTKFNSESKLYMKHVLSFLKEDKMVDDPNFTRYPTEDGQGAFSLMSPVWHRRAGFGSEDEKIRPHPIPLFMLYDKSQGQERAKKFAIDYDAQPHFQALDYSIGRAPSVPLPRMARPSLLRDGRREKKPEAEVKVKGRQRWKPPLVNAWDK